MHHPWKIGFLLMAGIVLFPSVNAATISGTVYDGLTLEVKENSIITIDTTPAQTKVSKDGSYSFDAGEGTYTLVAEYQENGIMLQRAENPITILEGGTYTIDLIMLPELGDVPNEPLPNEEKPLTIWDQLLAGPVIWLVLLGIVLGVGGYAIVNTRVHVWKAKKSTHNTEKNENEKSKQENENKKNTQGENTEKNHSAAEEKVELDNYAKEMIQHLKRGGNRLTQKELREKVTIGEAKVSLVVSELESEKIIKKIKKGRANILILTEKGIRLAEENNPARSREEENTPTT
ncbi:MAG: hypothetical protein FJY86_03425 [Candidatus Diapherotrites archaeon]|uniref:DUF7343 domain-containing protein n=1 Tax=Candidatus Iainarchaeum sp. TaxID=3101447 RepID=A0A8T4C823_9ARCH|nr:hypothetical protein [Candidatus Diapherotrites archaeon]